MMTHALYAGSFDPITKGHIDVIAKAANTFEKVTIGIGTNPKKKRLFNVDESMGLIADSVIEMLSTEVGDQIEIREFTGLSLSAFAHQIGASHIVRGLRQASDFDDEFTLHGVLERMDPSLTVVHFIAKAEFLHVSSSTARELASYGSNIDWLVTPTVAEALRQKF